MNPPLFTVGMPVRVGYMGLYGPDEQPTDRAGNPIRTPRAIYGLRPRERSGESPVWEYLIGSFVLHHLDGLCFGEWGWVVEADLVKAGYEAAAAAEERMARLAA